MLASSAAGVTVVGIDNGYGAACAASPGCCRDPRRLHQRVGRRRRRHAPRRADRRRRRPRAVGATLGGLGVDGWAYVRAGAARRHRGDVGQRRHRPPTTTATTTTTTTAPAGQGDRRAARRRRPPRPGAGHRPAVFDALAEAEGAVHGIDPADVEFHEVGAARRHRRRRRRRRRAALPRHRPHRRLAVAMGHGTTRSAHGVLPNPPPAVARLLAQRAVPSSASTRRWSWRRRPASPSSSPSPSSFGPLPAMTVERVGYGAGTADPAGPPERRAGHRRHRGRASADAGARARGRRSSRSTSTTSPARCSPTRSPPLLAAGAHDAWATPIVMKKGRPAHTVARARRSRRRRAAGRRAARRDRQPRRPGARRVERWPQRRAESPSTSTATRCGSSRPGTGPSPSTTTPSPPPPRSAGRCATSCGRPKRPPSALSPDNSVRPWDRSRSVISAGACRAAPTCCATSASSSATATGPRSSAPTASASRRCCG